SLLSSPVALLLLLEKTQAVEQLAEPAAGQLQPLGHGAVLVFEARERRARLAAGQLGEPAFGRERAATPRRELGLEVAHHFLELFQRVEIRPLAAGRHAPPVPLPPPCSPPCPPPLRAACDRLRGTPCARQRCARPS